MEILETPSLQHLLPNGSPETGLPPSGPICHEAGYQKSDHHSERVGDVSSGVTQQQSSAQVVDDDEVQFIFSAPRRRKKKRRRNLPYLHESKQQTREHSIDCKQSSVPTTPDQLRRGSAGMVQKLEFCHIGSDVSTAPKPSSLPIIPPLSSITPSRQFQSARTSSLNNTQSISVPVTTSSEPIQWSSNDALQDHNQTRSLSYWNTLPCQSSLSTNGRNGEFSGDAELSARHVDRQDSIIRMGGYLKMLEDAGGFSDLNLGCANLWETGITNRQEGSIIPTSDENVVSGIPHPTSESIQKATLLSSDIEMKDTIDHEPFPSMDTPSISTGISKENTEAQKLGTYVPVAMVPDQDVSPRTKTVPLSGPLSPSHYLSPYPLRTDGAIQTISAKSLPSQATSFSLANMSRRHQPLTPQQMNWTISTPPANTPISSSRPSRFDLIRKPSLYKIPAWAPPEHPPDSKLHSQGQQYPLNCVSNASQKHSPAGAGSNSFPPVSHSAYTNACLPSPIDSQVQRHVPLASQLPQPCVHSTQNSTNSAEITHHSGRRSNHKFSPNLIVDIAETCQQNFPFATVAERHNQPIQKVFDTFSAVIQLPLLRHAVDNRRHGSLGKRRIKDFREAKKAMEKAQEQEKKRTLREAKITEELGPAAKKGKRETPLLRAAVLNNAEKEGGT